MKKLILFLSLLILVSGVQAQGLKGKFMITLKAGSQYFLENDINRKTFLGSQIDYFLNDQILVGMNLNYMNYYHPVDLIEIEYSGLRDKDKFDNQWKWYSLTFSGKLLFEPGRFSPFFEMGVGFYIPQLTYYKYDYLIEGYTNTTVKIYKKTRYGFNLGIGVQYRVWKGFCLQFEGLINNVFKKSDDTSYDSAFNFAILNAGVSMIF